MPASIAIVAVPIVSGLILVSIPSYKLHEKLSLRNHTLRHYNDVEAAYTKELERLRSVSKIDPNEGMGDSVRAQKLINCSYTLMYDEWGKESENTFYIYKDKEGTSWQTTKCSRNESDLFKIYFEHYLKYTEV